MNPQRLVIIGLDGVPYPMVKKFAETGVMPNTSRIIQDGYFTPMRSTIPEISSVAWSSIITGENPGQHGIFGFTDLFPGSYKIRFPNFRNLKSPPFWDIWKRKSVIINVPSTYPVRKMNGVHVSGFVSIEFEKSVYPKSLVPTLNDMNYRLDVDSQKAHISMELFLADLDKTLNARIETCRYFWDNQDWQIFMLVFTGTDRLMHFLFNAYEDETHKYHGFFLEHFNKIDRIVGEINSKITDQDMLIMLSDHGFERLDYDVYINYLLRQQGFLKFKDGCDVTLNNISNDTKALALDPARIYLNLKGKFPCGSIEPVDIESVLCQLENLFRTLEVDGRKVVKDIFRKEQIYSGLYFEKAPDMVLVGAEGFNFKANVKAEQLADKTIFTGKHTQDTAFLITNKSSGENIIPNVPSVSDVMGIIERSKS